MAILGIPFLAGIIGSVITHLVTFFGKYFTKKVAAVAAVIVVVGTLTGGFIAIIEGLLSGIRYAMPAAGNWYVFIPDNFSACISAIITAEISRWVYDWNIKIVQWKLF